MSGNSGFSRAAHRADREQPLRAAGLGRAVVALIARKVSRYLPIWSSSPSSSSARSTRLLFTKVPFRLPWSSIGKSPPCLASTACLRETVTSSRKISQSGERPIVVRSSSSRNVSPRGRRRSGRRAPGPRSASASRRLARDLLGRERHRRVAASSRHEQRAAARAVVGGLRVLEAALGAVDMAQAAGCLRRAARPSGAGSSGERVDVDARSSDLAPLSDFCSRARARRAGCRSARGAAGAGTRPRSPRARARRSAP